MLERNAGEALWRQIERDIADAIRSGEFAPGTQLPTEVDLARRYGVNRHTLRRAVSELAEKGVVRVEQGRGTFVQDHVLDYLVQRRTRFSDNVLAQRRTPGGRVLKMEELPADAYLAHQLAIGEGAPVLLLERLGEVDGRPISVASHYLPAERFRGFFGIYEETHSISGALERFGCGDYVRRTTRVTARMPDATDAQHLQQPRTRPVLVAESINVDAEGRPIEFGIARYAADRFQMVFET